MAELNFSYWDEDDIRALLDALHVQQRGRVLYGVCNTRAETREKTVLVDEHVTSLRVGDLFHITFMEAQGFDGTPFLNVNALGAKSIQRAVHVSARQGEWAAGETVEFVWDGTRFLITKGGNGDPGPSANIIDDTAGSGDTDLVWSADKVSNIITKLTRHTTSDFTLSDLQAAVSEQNLIKYGIKPGDQICLPNCKYIVAGLNPYKGIVSSNHVGLIVVPQMPEDYEVEWNVSGNTEEGHDGGDAGYMNSDLHYFLTNTILPMCQSDLGLDHMYEYEAILSTAVDIDSSNRIRSRTGATTDSMSTQTYISALSEAQVYGGCCWSSSGHDTGEARSLLPVFAEHSIMEIFGRYSLYTIWLRDVASDMHACTASPFRSKGFDPVDVRHVAAGLILYH